MGHLGGHSEQRGWVSGTSCGVGRGGGSSAFFLFVMKMCQVWDRAEPGSVYSWTGDGEIGWGSVHSHTEGEREGALCMSNPWHNRSSLSLRLL